MIGMSLSTPPSPPINNNDLAFISALLATLSDPAASKKQLAAMQEARQAWQAACDAAVAKIAELDAKKAEHDAAIERERADHEAKLDSDRRKFDKLCNEGMAEISQKKTEANQLLEQAQADAAAAAKLKADYEKRLDLIKKAGAI
jgi:chromosome segregation ATPase